MTTARDIITATLTFGLNRLSPGEAIDADLGAVCLAALNHVADEWNGSGGLLFREVLTASTEITGASGVLGVAWLTLAPGVEILGATVQYPGGTDLRLDPITMGQYADIPVKSTASIPSCYAYDGLATVYFWPAAAGQTVTLRTTQAVSDFADLDTDYSMPKGYKSAFSAALAEVLAPAMIGGVTPAIRASAAGARQRIAAKTINPAILGGGRRGNILAGWT